MICKDGYISVWWFLHILIREAYINIFHVSIHLTAIVVIYAINWSPPSVAGSALIQVMACPFVGAKPLPETMFAYHQ